MPRVCAATYRAAENETVQGIARRLGIRATDIVNMNPGIARLTATSKLRADTRLRVPAEKMRQYRADVQEREAAAERERQRREREREARPAERQRRAQRRNQQQAPAQAQANAAPAPPPPVQPVQGLPVAPVQGMPVAPAPQQAAAPSPPVLQQPAAAPMPPPPAAVPPPPPVPPQPPVQPPVQPAPAQAGLNQMLHAQKLAELNQMRHEGLLRNDDEYYALRNAILDRFVGVERRA